MLHFWENDAAEHAGFLAVRLPGATANRAGIGARVTLRAGGEDRTKELGGGYGFFGLQHDTVPFFGLGACQEAETITVRWPDAELLTEAWQGVAGGRLVELRQGDPDVHEVSLEQREVRGFPAPCSIRSMDRRRRAWLAAWSVAACGGAAPGNEPAAPHSGPEPSHPAARLASAEVYDASGQARRCEAPPASCVKLQADRDFLDRCRLAGFAERQCGCELLCGGRVEAHPTHYAEDGRGAACEKERPECTPPEPSARFQDACNDAGHRLVVCGCEWRCSGKPRGSGVAAE